MKEDKSCGKRLLERYKEHMMSGNDDQEFFRSVDDQVFNDFSLSLIHFLSILILFSFFSFGVPAIFFQILLSSTSAGLLLIKLFCFCMSLRSSEIILF
jgi:hypothetical protein